MNGGRSDASTSTDDVKGRPLCLFYFTHPFGVLSPDPPTPLGAAPAHIARAFLNMEPVSPFYWQAAGEPGPGDPGDSYRSTATGESFELGAATVHAHPVSVYSVRAARAARTGPLPRCDSLSSSLFSSELWFESSCSSRAARDPQPARRLLPYNRMLPPLRLPSARTLSDCSEEDVWPRKCLHPEKFSLPPIELPPTLETADAPSDGGAGGGREPGARRRRLGVDKQRRRRRAGAADVRRVLACLIRRAVAAGGCGECSPSPALARVLATIRDAWAEPTTLRERCGIVSRTFERWMMEAPPPTRLPEPPPSPPARVHASPGLLRRRYSVPETIMRKYRLAQQRSDSEESVTAARWSATSACASPAREATRSPCDSPHRFLRRDRELMRKSALLRRMGARPCGAVCHCCEEARATRSLDGSHSELSSRRSPAPCARPWAESKRQRLHPPAAADFSDSTFQSHRAGRELCSCADTTDAFTDTESRPALSPAPSSSRRLSERVTAELERSPSNSFPPESRSYRESETLSASVSTAKETSCSPPRDSLSSNGQIEGRVSERSAGVDNEDRNVPSYERSLVFDTRAPVYELLEIVVSESSDTAIDAREVNALPMAAALTLKNPRDVDIDEYVSNILVESLNSLTDQLETMNASIDSHCRVSIVEKEIKVKLQNTGVNTIVHLSPTSNNQIIFGNEELCNVPCGARDECNNPLSIREERDPSLESNDNLTSSAGSPPSVPPPPPLAFDPPLQRDTVNRAVLHQIQKLFRDELRGLEEASSPPPAPPGVSFVEISNVDAYIEAHGAECAARPELEITTRADGELIAGVGTGNYFNDEAAAVPRFSAFPHTESMEVNTSSSSEGEPVCSECTSLVDSLDDPNSPRVASLRRRGDFTRSALEVLELLPERASADSRSEAFFVRIKDDDIERRDPDPLEETVRVAECMPEKIKQRLYRRHRKRELRMECARRSKVKQLKKELERQRLEEAAAVRRNLERDCVAIVNALIDDVIAKIARDEYDAMRIKRRNGKLPAAKSEENLARRAKRWDLDNRADSGVVKRGGSRRSSNKENRKSETHHIHGKLLARPSLTIPDRPPRRVYQKSEIHEGEKCIEILEIIEYVNGSQSSPETTNSDDNLNHNSRCKKSRIPIPVYERIQRTYESDGRMRLTGGDGRRTSPPSGGHALAGMLLRALGDSPLAASTPALAPPEPRSRSNSLRFKRVFDMIPEERSSLSFESSAEDAELARRASAPEVSAPVPQPTPAPAQSPYCVTSTRSAATSPQEERVRMLRSQTTMTSPCSKSAATSPLRAAEPPVPPRPAREGRGKEKRAEAVKTTAQSTLGECASACTPPVRVGGAGSERAPGAAGDRRQAECGEDARGRRRASVTGTGERRNARGSSSSDSGDSGGSLLCSLAPRWLSSHARQRRRARRPPPPPPHTRTAESESRVRPLALPPTPIDREPERGESESGGWSVTVAGSCRAALPADVEMRLRFPGEHGAKPAHRTSSDTRRAIHAISAVSSQECRCVQCARCAGARAALPLAPAPHSPVDPRLTLTMKKEAQDSSILASKSVRKSSELPELETYRASRTKTKSSVKTRRGYSLHCWLPDDERAPIRASNGLSVLGCAIIPELKPRVPTMSERDLTRVYTPRHYLRS